MDAWYWLLDHAQARIARVILPDGETHIAPVDTLESKSRWVAGPPKEALLGAPAAVQRMMLETLAASLNVVLPAALASSLYMGRDEWQLPALACGLGHMASLMYVSPSSTEPHSARGPRIHCRDRGLTGEAPILLPRRLLQQRGDRCRLGGGCVLGGHLRSRSMPRQRFQTATSAVFRTTGDARGFPTRESP